MVARQAQGIPVSYRYDPGGFLTFCRVPAPVAPRRRRERNLEHRLLPKKLGSQIK
jgi:hypothetical protein